MHNKYRELIGLTEQLNNYKTVLHAVSGVWVLTMVWASSGQEGNMTNEKVAVSKAPNALD